MKCTFHPSSTFDLLRNAEDCSFMVYNSGLTNAASRVMLSQVKDCSWIVSMGIWVPDASMVGLYYDLLSLAWLGTKVGSDSLLGP